MTGFAEIAAEHIRQHRVELSRQWLDQLSNLLPTNEREIFPSSTLLDHIPVLLSEIAAFLESPDESEVTMSSQVTAKARELGNLRHEQDASVHQILREYDLLATILEQVVLRLIEERGSSVPATDCTLVMQRIGRSIRLLMQTTVDTFLAEYDRTIEAQRNRLQDFNQTVSHQLRNPINSLSIAASLLDPADARGPRSQERIMQLVRSGVARTQRVLNELEIMTGTRVAADVGSPAVQDVELRAVVDDAVQQLSDVAAARDIEISIADVMPRAAFDVGKLDLVIVNLVANAIKYSDPSKPRGRVVIEADERNDGRIELSVEDNGIGIDEEALPRIFEHRFRGHSHLDRRLGVDGEGLGLSIVRDCVDNLKGQIEVESTPGRGSRFTVILPAR